MRRPGQPDTRFYRLRADNPQRISPPEDAQSHHSVLLENVTPGTTYHLRIRSTNGLPSSQELIWGFTGEFQMPGDPVA